MHCKNRDSLRRGAVSISFLAIHGFIGLAAQADETLPGIETPPGIVVIRTIPRSEADMALAYERSRSKACRCIPADQPVEMTDFGMSSLVAPTRKSHADSELSRPRGGGQGSVKLKPEVSSKTKRAGMSHREEFFSKREALPIPTARYCALSLGLGMLPADQRQLPTLSGGLILDYLSRHYLWVQMQVHKDLGTGELYLNQNPLAAVAEFRGARLTQEFVEMTAAAVNDMRALGLYVKTGVKASPENLRTAVLLFKHNLAEPGAITLAGPQFKPDYELLFVRLLPPSNGSRRSEPKLHVFATSDQRGTLHYLRTGSGPSTPDECSIKGLIFFTEYKYANRLPAASATRKVSVRAKASYALSDLDAYAAQCGWKGDASDNLTEVLDAIIDGQVQPSANR